MPSRSSTEDIKLGQSQGLAPLDYCNEKSDLTS